jgi:hypothetical protein
MRLTRFERVTYRLGGDRSIHLSYRRIFQLTIPYLPPPEANTTIQEKLRQYFCQKHKVQAHIQPFNTNINTLLYNFQRLFKPFFLYGARVFK